MKFHHGRRRPGDFQARGGEILDGSVPVRDPDVSRDRNQRIPNAQVPVGTFVVGGEEAEGKGPVGARERRVPKDYDFAFPRHWVL
ncbi:G-type lectin S-receptor-like serine/threonine-protein kinase SD2-2 [Pyrus ussuriensis x Pyrus communis]|uniref:G-type lectin S-receptor-like serine/threonine-protein kinase SD2-2 n=1 Tax=Pyrus ussuriensis x Pyrus communis TaxID=2448454 RepID=A0A5N5IC79_9ROSA|nr:G-type lectin S-receptor-like serine/threonine-protein kinase SD2-2 [Pyrus ussuriensis x Pyrus communis]